MKEPNVILAVGTPIYRGGDAGDDGLAPGFPDAVEDSLRLHRGSFVAPFLRMTGWRNRSVHRNQLDAVPGARDT